MPRFPFDIVGFDLDGTLLDTSADLAAAVNHALAGAGRPALPVAAIVPMIGGGARGTVAQALRVTGGCDEAMLDQAHGAMLAHYEANICDRTRPYPCVAATLEILAARGVRMGVATNKLARFAETLLTATGLRGFFTCVIGGDSVARGKPAPDSILAMVEGCGGGRAAFVGDSRYDVAAARAAGVPVVACTFGFSGAEAASLGADAVIAGYAELVPALDRIATAVP